MYSVWLAQWMEAAKGRIDPYAENELWDSIKDNKTQIEIPKLNEEGAINTPPTDGTPYLKVVCISDTHEQLHNVTVPDGDVLIHAGDFTNNGDENELIKFNEEMTRFPHKYKLVVAGNHELGFDHDEDQSDRLDSDKGNGTANGFELLTNVTYLQDKHITIDGIKFFGSSYHPLRGFPFYRTRASQLKQCWEAVPNDTDVLITHTPPLGYLDQFGEERWGCKDLLNKVEEVKPRYHIFGHVHERHGCISNGDTYFINAAQCNKGNQIQTRPFVFYIPKRTSS
uniref:Metallophos domain-containing protein n=1 Tax=Caenorhabditis tropicalis TaxID=1561998 RepID=A0A1I7V463_9PELO